MIKTLALVLKKQNIGETDRILTIISPTLGKKRVIVRAVRRPLSKLSGHLDTFMLSQIILTDEHDLPKITSALLTESFEKIRDSLVLTKRAFNISKLIERVILEEFPQRPIFQLTIDTLLRINENNPWEATWLYFLSRLTDNLGLGLGSFNCSGCKKPIKSSGSWLVEDRQLVCSECIKDVDDSRQTAGITGGNNLLGRATSQRFIRDRSSLQDRNRRLQTVVVHTNSVELAANSVKLLLLLRQKPFEMIKRINIPAKNASEVEEVFLREVTQWLSKPWMHYSGLS